MSHILDSRFRGNDNKGRGNDNERSRAVIPSGVVIPAKAGIQRSFKMVNFVLFVILGLCSLFSSAYAASDFKKFGEKPEVQRFIHMMVQEHHFDAVALTRLFNHVKYQPEILQKIQHPHEEKPWFEYRKTFVDEKHIQEGVDFWHAYAKTLALAEKEYQIPAEIIVAIIGMESNYGQNLGKFLVLEALATLAFSDYSRCAYFQKELKEYLLLCREKQLDPRTLLGSYAGAIGQPQFMPSSFRHYAINFSHSGHIDLIHNEVDVIGSIAHYLHEHEWHECEMLVIPAYKTSDLSDRLVVNALQEQYTALELARYHLLPLAKVKTHHLFGLVKLQHDASSSEYWLGLHNLYVITHYNHNIQYSFAAFELSQAIRERYCQRYQISLKAERPLGIPAQEILHP